MLRANLLKLEVDLLFFDGSSTHGERDGEDDGLLDDEDEDQLGEQANPVEGAARGYGRSKDHRNDLPQVVIGLAVTRQGIPVRMWTFPGDTSEQLLLRTVKDDLREWNLNRVIWVVDRGFSSAANRRFLQRGGGHYIMGEKLRSDSAEAKHALGRAGRYRTVAGNLRVKEARIDDGTARDRFVICHNPERAVRDAEVRARILARLEAKMADSDGVERPYTRRTRWRAQDQARVQPAATHHRGRQAAHRPRRRGQGGLLRRQVPAPHLRRDVVGRLTSPKATSASTKLLAGAASHPRR